jgi:type VI secretion system lysozyme-like protein
MRNSSAYSRSVQGIRARRKVQFGLFERLLGSADHPDAVNYSDEEVLLHSVARNLENALNVNMGSAAANPLLGMISFTDNTASATEVLDESVKAIRRCILRADSRIQDVRIRLVPDQFLPLALCFDAICTLRFAPAENSLSISMVMRDGKFHRHQ